MSDTWKIIRIGKLNSVGSFADSVAMGRSYPGGHFRFSSRRLEHIMRSALPSNITSLSLQSRSN